MKDLLKRNYDHIILVFITGIILFTYGDFTPLFQNDSLGYMEMDIIRSPFYPSFLALFRKIFGEVSYLNYVIIFQSLLACTAIGLFSYVLRKIFSYPSAVSFALYPFMLFPYIIEGIKTDGVIYTRAILTEGLSYSLFYFYLCLFLVVFFGTNQKKKIVTLFCLYVLSGFLVLLRGQMQLCLIISILLTLYLIWENRSDKKMRIKMIGLLFAGIIVATAVTKILTYAYTVSVFGESVKPEFANTSYMINFLYVSDYEDKELFADSEYAEFINLIFDDWDASGYSYDNKGEGWIENSIHLMDANLYLKLHAYIPMAKDYFGARGYNEVQTYQTYEKIAGEMLPLLAKRHFGKWFHGFMALFITGIPDMVFFEFVKLRGLCYVISFALLLAALGLSVFRLRQEHSSKAARLVIAVMIMMLGNLAACCLVIGPVLRYLTYFWGLFYISGLLLLLEFLCSYRKK